MPPAIFPDSQIFAWVVLPVLIFAARILDVSIGTVRIIFIAKGRKILAPILGFFEVSIWLLAVGQVLKEMNSPILMAAYAAGFAAGTFVGIFIEEKLAMGLLAVQVYATKDSEPLLEELRGMGFGVTAIPACGVSGDVHLIQVLIARKSLPLVVGSIEKFNPRTFYSVAEVRTAERGVFPPRPEGIVSRYAGALGMHRKGK